MKKVLLITYRQDNACAERVATAIRDRGGLPVVFDTDQYPTQTGLSLEYAGGNWAHRLHLPERTYDLGAFEAIWYRRVRIGMNLPREMAEDLRTPALEESRKTFQGMLESLDVFQVDRLSRIRYAENKQLQLKVATRLGLSIPRTLVTNDAQSVREFHARHAGGIVAKMQSSFAVYRRGAEHVVFTNQVKPEDLRYCPMTFQEKVSKRVELRITVVGREVFAAQIDSQSSPLAQIDWRRDGVDLIPAWEKHDLPEGIRQRLLALMDAFRLNYGAIDMILTPGGEYVFLEINPVGEFAWLERYPGFPVAHAIARVLLGETTRRN